MDSHNYTAGTLAEASPDGYKVPLWTDPKGFEWRYEAVWEQCEFAPDEEDANGELACGCCNPTEYIGVGPNGRQVQLCGEHFEKHIKPHCSLRYETLY